MPAITDPVAVEFSDTRIRPSADSGAALYWTYKSLIAQWNVSTASTKITNTTDIVTSPGPDNRNPITGINAVAIITEAINYVARLEANSNAILNALMAVAVNSGGKF